MSENILRGEMEEVLKKELRILLLKTREKFNLTQAKMAERYVMAENSYASLEKGEYKCGTLTIILLLNDQENPCQFLFEMAEKLDKVKGGEIHFI